MTSYKHGMSRTRIYHIWLAMNARTSCPKHAEYKNYGGRGIKVCKEWKEFMNFYNDMIEGYKNMLTIDRIDNDGDYCKSNCRWVTKSEQTKNRRNNILIEIDGVSKVLTEWCREYGISEKTGWDRFRRRGWSIEKTLNTPVKKLDPNRSCRYEGCVKPYSGRGLCKFHYDKERYEAKKSIQS
jgi:hypothetical protein